MYYAQNREDEIIEGILEVIGHTNRWCFEVGAGDGKRLSNTRRLIEAHGYTGVMVENNPLQVKRMRSGNLLPGMICMHEKIDGNNSIDYILHSLRTPLQLDVISIDVDGQDYWLWKDLVEHSGRIMVVEFNCYGNDFGIPERGAGNIVVPSQLEKQAGYYAIESLAKEKGYVIVIKTMCNIICLKKSILDGIKGDAVGNIKRNIERKLL